jgi:hypothetical protein
VIGGDALGVAEQLGTQPLSTWLRCHSGEATIDQRARELLLPGHELESIRFELVAVRVPLAERLPFCDERAERLM